ncbi:hypothetical protein AVEN_76022-1 [Araneus ventricosus]|uniref:Uncharacterized protein n=2 Tax=Araneus ventricosus TaxID=182803 RepID=A0A4Y2VG15_ARAVE|nr:hypothetical protein AVEN_76022-1 [Araneus ventricosus]
MSYLGSEFASRQCDVDGQWVGHPEKEIVNGWSNYSDCFTKEIKLLLDKLYTSSESDVQYYEDVRTPPHAPVPDVITATELVGWTWDNMKITAYLTWINGSHNDESVTMRRSSYEIKI